MLVLSRKKNEDIICFLPDGSEIRFVVVDIRGDKVRMGIEAPESIPVHRGELAAQIGGTTLEKGTVNLPGTNLHGLPCRVVSREEKRIILCVQLADKLDQYSLPQEAFIPSPPRDNATKKEV